MRYWATGLILFWSFLTFGQTTFKQSEQRFKRYLITDSLKAMQQLEFQRKHQHSAEEKVRYQLHLAEYHYQLNRLEQAEQLLAKVKEMIGSNDVESKGEYVRILSLIHTKRNDFAKSGKLINSFLRKHKQLPPDLKINLQLNNCENDIALGSYQQSKKRAMAGYKVFRRSPSELSDATKIRLLASLYNSNYYAAEYDSALYYLYQSEPYLKEGTVEKAGFYSRVAIVNTILHKQQKAIFYLRKSIAIFEKANVPVQLAFAWYNLGVSYKEVNEDKAITCFRKALKIAKTAGNDQVMGYALQDLGDLCLNRKEYGLARKYNLEALDVLQKAANDRGIVNVLLNLGRAEYETGQYDSALNYLKEALSMTEDSEDIAALEYCYEYLYKTYERMGDFRSAHRFYKLYAESQRRIFRQESRNHIEKLNIQYGVRVKEATNKLLRKQVVLKNNKIAAESTVKWLLGGLLVVAFGIIFLTRRALIQRSRLKELELQLVQSELKASEQDKAHAVSELEQVKQQLISKNALISELNKLVVENEQSLISRDQLSQLATNESDWVQFLAKLQILFPNFSDNLKKQHPQLSNNEFRLAALIRLNLSDKEISELLFIEISSVKKAKHRLKQKFLLETGDKLDVYLGQF